MSLVINYQIGAWLPSQSLTIRYKSSWSLRSVWVLSNQFLCWFFQVHRLDRETSGILLMGRTKDSVSHLQWLFSNTNNAKSSCKVPFLHEVFNCCFHTHHLACECSIQSFNNNFIFPFEL